MFLTAKSNELERANHRSHEIDMGLIVSNHERSAKPKLKSFESVNDEIN